MTEWQLASLPILLLSLLVVGGATSLAVAGMLVVRRLIPLEVLEANHEVGGILIQIVAPAYAVLLAFVVFAVWTQHDEAEGFVAQEANRVAHLFRIVQGMPEPTQSQIRESLHKYAQIVIEEEWDAMARGEASPPAWDAYDELTHYYTMAPLRGREGGFDRALLENLNALGDLRTRRLLSSQSALPGVLWILLVGGGVITMGFSYLFGMKNLWAQALMTAAAAGTIAFFLFLILTIDLPFTGGSRLTPEAFRFVLEHFGRSAGEQ